VTSEPFDTATFIQNLLGRGWRWDGGSGTRLLHPTNQDFYLRFDAATDKLTVSPALDEHLKLVIPTSGSKSRHR